MVIALIIMLPLAFIAGVFSALKSVQLGLKWQIQTAEKKEPELKTPIEMVKETIDERKQEEINRYTKEQMREYFFGAGGE